MFAISASYPLRDVLDDDLQGLAETLWGWRLCSSCKIAPAAQPCSASDPCQGVRWARMKTFFDYYKNITAAYVPDMVGGSSPALRGHADLFAIIRLLKASPESTRSELTAAHFSTWTCTDAVAQPPTADDQTRAFNLASRVMTTITCSLDTQQSYESLSPGCGRYHGSKT
jgi:hypothetical protein